MKRCMFRGFVSLRPTLLPGGWLFLFLPPRPRSAVLLRGLRHVHMSLSELLLGAEGCTGNGWAFSTLSQCTAPTKQSRLSGDTQYQVSDRQTDRQNICHCSWCLQARRDHWYGLSCVGRRRITSWCVLFLMAPQHHMRHQEEPWGAAAAIHTRYAG